MIESYYWKQDLLKYARSFKPAKSPQRWSEKLQVNFEKDVILAFFMIRKLAECYKLSSATLKYAAKIYRSPCIGKVTNMNFSSIERLYDLNNEKAVHKDVKFLCNQLVHGGAIFARRGADRNWDGIYTCSDFERQKYVYFIPLIEIIKILKLAGKDYPHQIRYSYNKQKQDYLIETN